MKRKMFNKWLPICLSVLIFSTCTSFPIGLKVVNAANEEITIEKNTKAEFTDAIQQNGKTYTKVGDPFPYQLSTSPTKVEIFADRQESKFNNPKIYGYYYAQWSAATKQFDLGIKSNVWELKKCIYSAENGLYHKSAKNTIPNAPWDYLNEKFVLAGNISDLNFDDTTKPLNPNNPDHNMFTAYSDRGTSNIIGTFVPNNAFCTNNANNPVGYYKGTDGKEGIVKQNGDMAIIYRHYEDFVRGYDSQKNIDDYHGDNHLATMFFKNPITGKSGNINTLYTVNEKKVKPPKSDAGWIDYDKGFYISGTYGDELFRYTFDFYPVAKWKCKYTNSALPPPPTGDGKIKFTPNTSFDISGNREGWVNTDIPVKVEVTGDHRQDKVSSISRTYTYISSYSLSCGTSEHYHSSGCYSRTATGGRYLDCGQSSHRHSGNSSTGGGCYGTENWSNSSANCSFTETWKIGKVDVTGDATGSVEHGGTVTLKNEKDLQKLKGKLNDWISDNKVFASATAPGRSGEWTQDSVPSDVHAEKPALYEGESSIYKLDKTKGSFLLYELLSLI